MVFAIVITQIIAVGLSFAHMASGVLVVNGVPVIITRLQPCLRLGHR